MRRILFVTSDEQTLTAIKKLLKSVQKQWSFQYVTAMEKAHTHLGNNSYDVLIADLFPLKKSDVKHLEKIRDEHPEVVRVLLADSKDAEIVAGSSGIAHQFLSKPLDPKNLKTGVERALGFQSFIADSSVQNVISKVSELPSLPKIYTQIMEELNKENSSLDKVGTILAQDMGMSAKILKLANSPFFGFSRNIANPSQAVTLLGINIVKSLILSSQIFNQEKLLPLRNFSFDGLWEHCLSTGIMAKAIAAIEEQPRDIQDAAFTAGLLHDSGKLVLLANYPDKYKEVLHSVKNTDAYIWQAEEEIFGTHHGRVGAYLMALWGLPGNVLEAIAFHHEPRAYDDSFQPLTAVHAGNVLEHQTVILNREYQRPDYDRTYLKDLGVDSRRDVWLEKARTTGRARDNQ